MSLVIPLSGARRDYTLSIKLSMKSIVFSIIYKYTTQCAFVSVTGIFFSIHEGDKK
jgi:hypothetical protein